MSESTGEVLAREAAQAEARAEAEERGEVMPTPGHRGRRPAADPSQVYTVRIPVSRLRELRVIADELGEPPSTLIRRWVLERLDAAESEAKGNDVSQEQRRGGLRLGRRRQQPYAEASISSGERRRYA
jgi:hypothetical protein